MPLLDNYVIVGACLREKMGTATLGYNGKIDRRSYQSFLSRPTPVPLQIKVVLPTLLLIISLHHIKFCISLLRQSL